MSGAEPYAYSTRGEVVRVRMSRLAAGQATGFWYNSRSGDWHLHDAGRASGRRPFATGIPSGPGAPDLYFDPPGEPADGNDWVLVIEVEQGEGNEIPVH